MPVITLVSQILAILLCCSCFFITSSIPIATWKKIYKPIAFLAVGATLLAIVLPVNPSYPAHRWVRLGGLSFQSVELSEVCRYYLAGSVSS